MTRTNKTMGAALAGMLLIGGGAAIAGSSVNPPASKEIKDMECLVGNWKGAGQMVMGADKVDVKLAWGCKRSAGDWGVLCGLKMTGIPGMASYEETDLFGFEPGTGKYHWFSVTNAGETHDHVADLPKGDDVHFVYTGTQEGKPFREVIDMHFRDGTKTVDIKAETFLDGKSTSTFAATLRK
jgi:hypothetical protein